MAWCSVKAQGQLNGGGWMGGAGSTDGRDEQYIKSFCQKI